MSLKNLLFFVLLFSITAFLDSPGSNSQIPQYIIFIILGMTLIVLLNLTVTLILLKKYSEKKADNIKLQDTNHEESERQKDELLFTQKYDGQVLLDKKLEQHLKPVTDSLNELKIAQYYDFEGNVTWNFFLQKKMNEVLEKFEVLKRQVDSQDITAKEIVTNLKKMQTAVSGNSTPGSVENYTKKNSSGSENSELEF